MKHSTPTRATPRSTSAIFRKQMGELLLEVDQWTDFTRHFTHLRTDALPKDRSALLTVILADAINLGLTKMAEACPGTTFNKLDTVRAWHVRDESYSKGLAELVNYQHRLPFASHWGTGKTSPALQTQPVRRSRECLP